jgi:7-cyano-7-deazaguanine tRNA-ribosyltransferase
VFEVRGRDGLGRLGVLETRHGRVATPALLPVVNPNRPLIPPRELATRFRAEIVITNAYILGKPPLRDAVLDHGVHGLLDFPGVVMTDSGAFQSHVYGSVDVSNADVVRFQASIGSDLGTMLDPFSEPEHGRERASADVEETIRRAREADSLRGEMGLVGAVQGGLHEDLRELCAREVSSLGIDVAAIGGVVPLLESYRFRDLVRVIVASKRGLDPSKPVHLFGAGHPIVFPLAALLGCDLFDSASYAKYARDGRMMFPDGTRRASELAHSGCACPACSDHPVSELARDEKLLAEHNLHVCMAAVGEVRRAIAAGELWELVERTARRHPALLDALAEVRRHADFLEEFEPISRPRALYYVGPETAHRPVLARYRRRLRERYAPPAAKGLVVFPEGERPYSDRRSGAVARILEASDVHFVVRSAWGPVPLELDHVWPLSQSVLPERLDLETLEASEVFLREWAEGAGYPFGRLWEGEATLDELRSQAPGGRRLDWNRLRVRATADLQFGRGAADALFSGDVRYVVSKNTGRIRNVFADEEHVVSMRAEDGWFSLKVAGARRLHAALASPRLRIFVDPDAVPFHREGKNVMAKFVVDADPELRPGDDVLVVSPRDELCAVARAVLTRREMLAFRRGVAAHVREGVPLAPAPRPGPARATRQST